MSTKKVYKPERNGAAPAKAPTNASYRTIVLSNSDAQEIVSAALNEDAEEIMLKLFRERAISIKLKFEEDRKSVVVTVTPTKYIFGKSNTIILTMRSLAYALPAVAHVLENKYPNFPGAFNDDAEDDLAI